MNNRVAKTLRRLGREKSKRYDAPERQLVKHSGVETTAINHPATARGMYLRLKQQYYKGIKP